MADSPYTTPLAIYVRVSEVGGREGESFGSPVEQEAAAREWAEREGLAVYFDEDECVDLDVSGAAGADDRRLGALIERCEAGEFSGIIVRDERRFSRDPISGGVALERLTAAKCRFRATWSGFDTGHKGQDVTPESQMVFDIMMAIGKAERARNKANRVKGIARAVERGIYVAAKPPWWARWIEGSREVKPSGKLGNGKIEPDPALAPFAIEAYERRAGGQKVAAIHTWLVSQGVSISRGLVERMFHPVHGRVALGEVRYSTGTKGEPETKTNAHPRIISDDLFEQVLAQEKSYFPRDGSYASHIMLPGIVQCMSGHTMKAGKSGAAGAARPAYQCVRKGCQHRTTVTAAHVDTHVHDILARALLTREQHVGAILEGSDRYAEALEAVTAARTELDFYRANVKVSDVGVEEFKADVAIRQSALDVARDQLRKVRKPKEARVVEESLGSAQSFEEAEEMFGPSLLREHLARFVARVEVAPVGQGQRVPMEARLRVWFVGAEEPTDITVTEAVAGMTPVATEVATGSKAVAA